MFNSLSRDTLSDQVAQQLLDFIVAQELKPGARLPSEQKLTQAFQVSRPVIREALRSLAGKSIIEIVNGKGAIIKPLNAQPLGLFFQRALQIEQGSILEILEVRQGLEMQSARLAAERRTDEERDGMTDIVETMRKHLNNADRYVNLDGEFHVRIAQATHHAILHHIITSIRTALADAIRAGLRRQNSSEARQTVQATHEAILEAIVRGDGPSAERAMQAHFENAVNAIMHVDTQPG